MTNYAQHFSPNNTPQTSKAKENQIKNYAGGYVFKLDPLKQLERFLILGSDQGSYYASEKTLTVDNAKCVIACCDTIGVKTVDTIVDISDSGRAPKNSPAIFALAIASGHSNVDVRRAAFEALPKVCRTATALFEFIQARSDLGFGWGRGMKNAVNKWYSSKSDKDLCYQLAKYQQRNGISHRDVFRLTHPDNLNPAISQWVVGVDKDDIGKAREVKGNSKIGRRDRVYSDHSVVLPDYLAKFDELKHADEKRTIELIQEYGFTHEMIDTNHKNSVAVWDALLQKMPITALVRNLAKMTQVGLLKPLSDASRLVCERLNNVDNIRKARLHPINILSALKVYQQGHGEKGSLVWSPVGQIVDALDRAFYLGFQAIEPSNKNIFLAIDVSGSMDGNPVAGIPGIDCRMAAAAMAMVTARTEKNWHIAGFASGGNGYGGRWGGTSSKLVDINITPNQRLDDVMNKMSQIPMGGTDCALPMLHATSEGLNVDCFAVYTDNETWAGSVHPFQALNGYRKKANKPNSKLVVSAFTATPFTIADPSDPGMLDIVGLDSSGPALIADFIRD